MAAEQGEVWSQFSVGRFYMNGYGVQQDYKEAYF
jgi:TPR repeat protein